ncbi:MAG TPA: glycosyltransferase [Sumerlaeia bacterium]|nr:glycosyltransferase [Sumerlaeia bacterium]
MNRIRVAHIINDMGVGGAQRQVANLFRAIDRARFDLRLICLAKKGAFGEQLERDGFEVVALGKRGRVHLAMMRHLVRVLREWRPDVAHCSVFTANLWGRIAGKLAGVPVLITHEQSAVSLEKRHRRWIDRVLSRFTFRVLAVSDDLRRRVIAEEGVSTGKVEVLYNAIDCDEIERATAAPLESFPGRDGFRVGIVGRLECRKDHLTLVRAAARVVREIPHAAFLLVGDGPDRPAVEREIARLGLEENVRLLGERDDVPRLLRAFDLYVLSSVTEGLSLSILEAMAAGRAVVATRVGGNPELLEDGKAGILVPAQDPEAMADAVARLLKDPEERRTLGERARARAREVFDVHPIARRLEEIYERALEERGRKRGKQ